MLFGFVFGEIFFQFVRFRSYRKIKLREVEKICKIENLGKNENRK